MPTIVATLCYVKHEGRTLMIHRSRPGDRHFGKWNGLGGKAGAGESPDKCVIREVAEEAGIVIDEPRLRGVILFPRFDETNDWLVFVYTAVHFEGTPRTEHEEGHLEWIPDTKIGSLHLWDADRIFLPWLEDERMFVATITYSGETVASHEVRFHGDAGKGR